MAIIPIKEVPRVKEALSQRDLVCIDIKSAVTQGVPKFEFSGDKYRYKTLARNATQAFAKYYEKDIYIPAMDKAKKHLDKEFPDENIELPACQDYIRKAAVFSTRKLKDGHHVYCELNLPLITSLERYIYIDALKKLYKRGRK